MYISKPGIVDILLLVQGWTMYKKVPAITTSVDNNDNQDSW